jgi:DNA-binding NarL/FixJ family response regulator
VPRRLDCHRAIVGWDEWPRPRVAVTKGANEYKGAPARVVFADDDAVLRELLRGLLGFLPHVTVVGEAADGIEAVQLVARHYPDTVLLDITMPRLDGIAAAEVIRSFRPQTRLMLHTAEPDDEKRRCAKALGLPLLDKLQLNATTDLIEQYAVSDEHPLATDIEPLVLAALANRATLACSSSRQTNPSRSTTPPLPRCSTCPSRPSELLLPTSAPEAYSGSAPTGRPTRSRSSHLHGPSPAASLSRTWSISAPRMARYGRLR